MHPKWNLLRSSSSLVSIENEVNTYYLDTFEAGEVVSIGVC